jgi:hypothetical protein
VDPFRYETFAIRGDRLAEAGVIVCHSGVGLSSIGVDGCPKVRVEICHWGVDFWFIGVDEGGIASHWGVGCTLAKRSSSFAIRGDCLAGAGMVIHQLCVGLMSIGVDGLPQGWGGSLPLGCGLLIHWGGRGWCCFPLRCGSHIGKKEFFGGHLGRDFFVNRCLVGGKFFICHFPNHSIKFESAGGLGLLSMLKIFGGGLPFCGLSRSKDLGGGWRGLGLQQVFPVGTLYSPKIMFVWRRLFDIFLIDQAEADGGGLFWGGVQLVIKVMMLPLFPQRTMQWSLLGDCTSWGQIWWERLVGDRELSSGEEMGIFLGSFL